MGMAARLLILISGAHCVFVFQADEKSKYELMGSYGQQRFLQEMEGERLQAVNVTGLLF